MPASPSLISAFQHPRHLSRPLPRQSTRWRNHLHLSGPFSTIYSGRLHDWGAQFLATVAQERRRQREALGITDAETPVYGYRLQPGAARATLVPEQAAVIQAIFAGSAAGQSCAKVAVTLNATGHRLLTGVQFTAQAVHAIRRDSHYMLSVNQDAVAGDDRSPEPLIPWEQWRAAQLGAPDGVKLS